MIPLMEDPGGGGGCTVTPLGPCTNMLLGLFSVTLEYRLELSMLTQMAFLVSMANGCG